MASPDPERAMPNFRPLLISLLVNIGLPAIAIQLLTHNGVALLYAIVASAVFPLGELLLSVLRRGRADVISILSLVLLLASAGTALLGNDPRYVLVRDSALTSIAGFVFLGSLLRPRPLMFELSRQTMPGATAQMWEERWQTRPLFRRAMISLTVAWGVGLIVDSIVRVVASLLLSPATTVIVSPLIAACVFGGLILYTIVYIRIARRNAAAT